MLEEEGEAEDPEEDEVVEPAVPDCHPDQAPTLEMEFEDEMQVESYWRIEAAAAEAACKDDQPKEETCDDEDDEKNGGPLVGSLKVCSGKLGCQS